MFQVGGGAEAARTGFAFKASCLSPLATAAPCVRSCFSTAPDIIEASPRRRGRECPPTPPPTGRLISPCGGSKEIGFSTALTTRSSAPLPFEITLPVTSETHQMSRDETCGGGVNGDRLRFQIRRRNSPVQPEDTLRLI